MAFLILSSKRLEGQNLAKTSFICPHVPPGLAQYYKLSVARTLPMSRANFHSHRDVRVIDVRLYMIYLNGTVNKKELRPRFSTPSTGPGEC